MFSFKLGDENLLQLDKDFFIELQKFQALISCHVVDGQRFGKLSHRSCALEHARAPNIIVLPTSHNQLFVVSADTQAAHMRSALCWLRERAGFGCSFEKNGGVCLINVARGRSAIDDGCPLEAIAKLVYSIRVVLPSSTFEDAL